MSEIDPLLKIYVEQLRGGKNWPLHADLAPDFLQIEEEELAFKDPVRIDGEAYLAQDELVVQVSIKTKAEVPCCICNDVFKLEISVPKLIQVEPLEGIKRGYFDISELLREAILLEVPLIAECHEGKCPKRKEIERLLLGSSHEKFVEEQGYRPFENLTLDDKE